MTALLISAALSAQGSVAKMTGKNFLAFHAGPSFPVGDFNSTSYDNVHAGYAQPGSVLHLNYGYRFNENFGLAAQAYYNNHLVDKDIVGHEPGVKFSHWEWYGLTAGPMLTQQVTRGIYTNVQVMGGVANAKIPKASYMGETIASEDWAAAPVFNGGLGLQFDMSRRYFLLVNADYLYMKPKFTVDYMIPVDDGGVVTGIGETDTFRQPVSVVNVTAGFGIRF